MVAITEAAAICPCCVSYCCANLSSMPDALILAQPELGIRFVPFDRVVWSFTGGALIQQALEKYLPLTTLVDLVRHEAAKVRTSG